MTKVFIESFPEDRHADEVIQKIEKLCVNLKDVHYYFKYHFSKYPNNSKNSYGFNIKNIKPDFIIGIDYGNFTSDEKKEIRNSNIHYRFIKRLL